MKKILLIIAILFLFFNNLHAAKLTIKQTPTLQKWNSFKATGIKSIRLTHVPSRNQLKVHLGGIKAALEKAAIDEKVSVFLNVDHKRIAFLGSYSPSKNSGAKGAGKVLFNQMPAIKNIKLSKNQKIPRDGNAVLVFKNATGAVVARITTKILQGKANLKDNTSIPR
jgi:hypothetical protein